MIGKLRALVERLVPEPAAGEPERDPELAVAVLLVEMARADHRLSAAEESAMATELQTAFGLAPDGARDLLDRARVQAENAVSLQEFTRALHESMDYDEKQRVIEMLWQVALADKQLDKYEDYLVGKVGELLYVSRGDVIRLRERVIESLNPGV